MAAMATGMLTHLKHAIVTPIGAQSFPFGCQKVAMRIRYIDTIDHVGAAASMTTGVTMIAASMVTKMAATSSSMVSTTVDSINTVLFCFLLVIFELSRAMNAGNLLGEISTGIYEVSGVLLVDNNLYCK